jgi:tetratricopeptide (TPR) repeat protein
MAKAKTKRKPDEVSLENLPDPAVERQVEATEPELANPRARLSTEPLDVIHAWFVLLPALVLAWPWPSLLAHDPVNAATAAGWTLWLSLPAGAMAIVRGRIRWHWGLLALLFLFLRAAFTDHMGADIDVFEASRGYVALVGMFTVFVSATGLGPVGRRTLGRGVTIVGGLVLLGWFTNLFRSMGLEGSSFRETLLGFDLRWTLGNSGDLAEALIPAALATIAVAAGATGSRRWTLSTVAALSAFAVTWSGSRAGWLVAIAGAILLVALRPGRARSWAPSAGILAGVLVAMLLRSGLESMESTAPTETTGPQTIQVQSSPDATRATVEPDAAAPTRIVAEGGLRFRQLTWSRVPDLWMTAPWVGVGTGQFRREFPPHRDHEEIGISSHGRSEPTFVDVEHPHSDPLLVIAEYGLIGGVGFFAFLVWIMATALRQLARGDHDRRAAALGVIGALILGLQNCGLFYGLVSPSLWMAMAGSVIAANGDGQRRARSRDRAVAGVVMAFALWASVAATCMIGHGRALAQLSNAEIVEGKSYLEPLQVREFVDKALRFAPNSPVALERLIPSLTGEEKRDVLDRLIALRPHQRSALINRGNEYARAREFDAAREMYQRVIGLDPDNPLAGIALARTSLDLGRTDEMPAALDRLAELGAASTARLRDWGASQLLSGRPALAEIILTRVNPKWTTSDPGVCYAQSILAKERNDDYLAGAFLAGAQLGFARNHARGQIWNSAVTSYNQALRYTKDRPSLGFQDGAPIVIAELSAALWKTGRTEEATARFQGVVLSDRDRDQHLAPWARELLTQIGFL